MFLYFPCFFCYVTYVQFLNKNSVINKIKSLSEISEKDPSTRLTTACPPPRISLEIVLYRRASNVQCSLRAYCRGSILSSSTWGRSLVHVKPSMIFDTVQVRDIGLISFSMAPGGHTLGKGATMKYLSRDGILTPLP